VILDRDIVQDRRSASGAGYGADICPTRKPRAHRDAADAFAANVLPIVRQIQASGAATFRAIATALNNRGVRTARGGIWRDSTVRNLLARAS
jgi:Recombinase